MVSIESLDHLVITTPDIEKMIRFYVDVLGMKEITFKQGRKALQFGNQKINLHEAGQEFSPHAAKPTPGSQDLCFLSSTPTEEWIFHLEKKKVPIEEGPVIRTGAVASIRSIYIRDPDNNLIEIGYSLVQGA